MNTIVVHVTGRYLEFSAGKLARMAETAVGRPILKKLARVKESEGIVREADGSRTSRLEVKKKRQLSLPLFPGFGRGGGIRTRDPLHPMQVRYQAALRPE